MRYINTFLFLLAIPFLLVRMKIEHFKMERENKRKIHQKGNKNPDLLMPSDGELKRKLT